MNNNEITVSINQSFDDVVKHLETTGFIKQENFVLDDIYYIPSDINLEIDFFEILNKSIILRKIDNVTTRLIFKKREFDGLGNILEQSKVEMDVLNFDEATNFLKVLDYKHLIKIYDNMTIFKKGDIEFGLQQVNDKYLLLEFEENDNIKGIQNLISIIDSIGIDYDKSNYFVKKAELIFMDTYKK